MRKEKWNKTALKDVLGYLDKASKKYGLKEVRHAAAKWNSAQADKARLTKARRILEQELAEVNKRLAR